MNDGASVGGMPFALASTLYTNGPRIISFEFDAVRERFTSIVAEPKALLGYTDSDWLAPGFIATAMTFEEGERFRNALTARAAHSGEILECFAFCTAGGIDVHLYIVARFRRDGAGRRWFTGQMINIEDLVASPQRSAIRNGAGQEFISLVSTRLSASVRTISDVSSILERHLAGQADDVGGEFAVEIRGAITELQSLAEHMRAMAMGQRLTVERVSRVLSELAASPAEAAQETTLPSD